MKAVGDSTNDCFIQCKGENTCQYMNLLCPEGVNCRLNCKGKGSCYGSKLYVYESFKDEPNNDRILRFNANFVKEIDDLGSKKLKTINFQIKNVWEEFHILKKRRENKMQSFKKKEENNFAIKEMYKILEEANLNSGSEILELQSKELRLSNNIDINHSIQVSLDN